MKFLLDVPFVMSLADWVWGKDPDAQVSPELCVEAFPVMNGACWSQLVVKALGIAIIAGACLNKAPIMLNILDSKSTAGLSRTAIYGETICYASAAFYGMLEGHPVTAYGENVALLIQSVVIILMMFQFTVDPKVSTQERVIATGLAVAYVAGVATMLPEDLHYLLMGSILPVMLFARGSQIFETLMVQHTGAQSIVTTAMNLVGGILRILTTIKEVGWDMAVLSGLLVGTIMNVVMFLQYFYYRSNTEKFVKELKEKKQS
jgi:mannose-P-dolichol utilization defect protein 1